MADHPAADQPDPIASPDQPDQPLRGPQWARVALANQHDSATKARQIAEMPQSEFMGSGFFAGDGQVIPEALLVDDDEPSERDQLEPDQLEPDQLERDQLERDQEVDR